jgi:tRNA pseudouridine38-40 synthase
MRVAVKFAYNGKSYHGFVRQPNLKTVEQEILDSLVKYNIIKNAKDSCFRYASRTDKGVSALGNVIAFDTKLFESSLLKKISSEDIIFYAYLQVEPDFYPRYAKYRQYRYYLKNQDYDFEKIISISNNFIGKHNFSNFAKVELEKDPYRQIENIIITKNNKFIIFDFYAETFLWNQIRRIISAITKASIGKITEQQIIQALKNPLKKIDFGLAPAEPLISYGCYL